MESYLYLKNDFKRAFKTREILTLMNQKLQKIKALVEKELSCSAHNMEHTMRVYNLCLELAEDEPVDLDVLKPAALLHDIARVKEDTNASGTIDHAVLGAEMAETILRDLEYSEKKIQHITHCIITHRFRGTLTPHTKEAKILYDADKLDVLGAVGVARCFMVAGRYNERMYSDTPLDEYIKENLVNQTSQGKIKDISKHAPNIELETKFKHIPGSLYTEKAREIARKRLTFMIEFFEQLHREINGKL